MKPNLPQVTLLGFDGQDPDALARVLNYCSNLFEFAEVKMWSPHCPGCFSPQCMKVTHQFVPDGSLHAYNAWEIGGMDFDTDFALCVQKDGFIINPQKWDPLWLNYDYLGAPWPATWPNINKWDNLVGNGGFSLRSKKFVECSKRAYPLWNQTMNSDVFLCRVMYQCFMDLGIHYAPIPVADGFSWEARDDGIKGKAFGFHHGNHLPLYQHLIK